MCAQQELKSDLNQGTASFKLTNKNRIQLKTRKIMMMILKKKLSKKDSNHSDH